MEKLKKEFEQLFTKNATEITACPRIRLYGNPQELWLWILNNFTPKVSRVELPVKPANDGYYYLRNLKDNKDYDLETYAAKFTKLCYPDIECVCKAIDTQDYYLLDECGNYDYINTEEWSIILTDPEEYRRKVLNNEFVKFKKL